MFTPRYIKHSKLLLRHAQKYLRYKSDLLSTAAREELSAEIGRLRQALGKRDHDRIRDEAQTLDAKMQQLTPVTWESHWRENVEVIFVAIVVAVGIRSYFLQPFKIPTGSMQPTLNGIIAYPYSYPYEAAIPPDRKPHYEFRNGSWFFKDFQGYSQAIARPNLLKQVVEFVMLGRNYINVVSQQDDQVIQVQQKKMFFFFTFSRVTCQHQTFLVYCPPDQLRGDFKVTPNTRYKRGDIIARGAVDTGDQVFVDKFTYNFLKPHRGDVFVFRTNNIPGIPGDIEMGQPFYIKRLAGLPGDSLRIESPRLYINGKLAEAFGFRRVMEAKDSYRGYGLGAVYLSAPNSTYVVPLHGYFALGDNSYNSLDSRYWGSVPEDDLVGRGLVVYWPFNRHWGLIR
jgi:signal peptidase I